MIVPRAPSDSGPTIVPVVVEGELQMKAVAGETTFAILTCSSKENAGLGVGLGVGVGVGVGLGAGVR
jgi:hypothetical protein